MTIENGNQRTENPARRPVEPARGFFVNHTVPHLAPHGLARTPAHCHVHPTHELLLSRRKGPGQGNRRATRATAGRSAPRGSALRSSAHPTFPPADARRAKASAVWTENVPRILNETPAIRPVRDRAKRPRRAPITPREAASLTGAPVRSGREHSPPSATGLRPKARAVDLRAFGDHRPRFRRGPLGAPGRRACRVALPPSRVMSVRPRCISDQPYHYGVQSGPAGTCHGRCGMRFRGRSRTASARSWSASWNVSRSGNVDRE